MFFDGSKAVRELGVPQSPIEPALARAVRWFVDHGYAPRVPRPGRCRVKVLCCHPSGLMYTEIYLRLEPLGVELVAAAARRAGPRGAHPRPAGVLAAGLPARCWTSGGPTRWCSA